MTNRPKYLLALRLWSLALAHRNLAMERGDDLRTHRWHRLAMRSLGAMRRHDPEGA